MAVGSHFSLPDVFQAEEFHFGEKTAVTNQI
jgi:hypothetical protein